MAENKQITLDPRQALAKANYINPKSPTFADLKNSMIEAGYDEGYADNIYDRKPLWLTQGLQDTVDLVKDSENNLRAVVKAVLDPEDPDQVDLVRTQMTASIFVLKTVGRSKYSEEKELPSPNVQVNITSYADPKDGKVIDVSVSAQTGQQSLEAKA